MIEACISGEPESVVVFEFSEDECTSVTTKTTVYLDTNGNEKARREEVEISNNLSYENCCNAAKSPESSLLLACEAENEYINEQFTFD